MAKIKWLGDQLFSHNHYAKSRFSRDTAHIACDNHLLIP